MRAPTLVSIAGLVTILAVVSSCTSPWRASGEDPVPSSPLVRDEPPNVLLICVDDLRPELGCYGVAHVKTPNIDRLAASARVFDRHYVQVPTCGASRFALMTGRRPAALSSYGNWAFRALRANSAPMPLPALFRRSGYRTVSIGKVSHQPDGTNVKKEGADGNGDPEMPESWDEVVQCAGKWKTGWGAFFGYADGSARVRGETPALERADVPDKGYPDGLIAAAAVDTLRELERDGERFLLAVGFYKPHLPFNAPSRYWELYDEDEIALSRWPEVPAGVDPTISLHGSPELLGNYGGHPSGSYVGDDYARRLRHAYLACVSYVDAQIGKVLDAVDELGLAENTIVILWGDHGWHLGDLGVWGKHTNHELALRSPLMLRAPGLPSPGMASRAIVESVDIYPTLTELCRLSAPERLGGSSLVPQLEDPTRKSDGQAFGYHRAGRRVGHTLRTDRHRVVRWFRDGEAIQTELYDHLEDPGETRNIAMANPELAERLASRLPAPPPMR